MSCNFQWAWNVICPVFGTDVYRDYINYSTQIDAVKAAIDYYNDNSFLRFYNGKKEQNLFICHNCGIKNLGGWVKVTIEALDVYKLLLKYPCSDTRLEECKYDRS